MKTIELREEKLSSMNDTSKDFCNDYYASYSDYICDAFMNFADGCVDIYYSDRARWFADNWSLVDDANAEFGQSGDVMQDIAQAQYLQASNELYDDIEDIILALAYEYLEVNGLKELTEEQNEIVEEMTNEIDNNSRLNDIADYLDANILNVEEGE